jgi:hypothetical protein
MTTAVRRRSARLLIPVAAAAVLLFAVAPLTSIAQAATPPPAQDTTAFCKNAGANPFSDNPSGVHQNDITCLAASGVTKGKTATTYDPGGTVQRGQMASFVARAIDEANKLVAPGKTLTPLPPYDGVDRFVDVSPSDAHVADINRLAQAGIVNGTGPGMYSPNVDVSRAQMASFINRSEKFMTGTAYSTSNTYFSDVSGDSHEADINAITSVGIAQGVSSTTYAPGNPVSRAQMASFIIRWLAVENAQGRITVLPSSGAPSAQSASINDADQSGALSKNDVVTITFANPIAATSSLTLTDADSTKVTLTDTSPTPSGQTPATFTLDTSKKVLTVTVTGTVVATGGDGILNGAVTITGASGITDATSGTAWDPTKDTQANVQFTFPATTGQSGVVTFVDVPHKTYAFTPNGGNSTTTVLYKANDSFTDDGTSATLAKFESDLSVGDLIKFTKNTPSAGTNRHDLTNKTPASYTSGMVGKVNTTTHVFSIIDPVSGVALSDVKTYGGGTNTFSVDGTNASLSVFEGAISEGDTVSITAGSGGGNNYALSNQSVQGAVSFIDTSGTNHFVKIGNLGDDPTSAQDASFDFSLAGTTLTVDGASATASAFASALSLGDQLTYARNNGVQTMDLVNKPPTPISGVVTETHSAAGKTVTVVNGPTRIPITYTAGANFTVDGVGSTEAQFEAALTAGDSLVWQAGDVPTTTHESMALTNSVPDKTVTGTMANINGGGTTYDVVNSVGGVIYAGLQFVAPPPADFGNLPSRYFVKAPGGTESEVTLPQFEAYLNKINSATSPIANIVAGLNSAGTAIEHHLTTDQTIP